MISFNESFIKQLCDVRDELNRHLNVDRPTDLDRCGKLIASSKLALLKCTSHFQIQLPHQQACDALVLCRELTELALLHAVHTRSVLTPLFAQLLVFYTDLAPYLAPSPRRSLLVGLYLLHLLAENDLPVFHAALELLPIEDSAHTAYVIGLYRSLNEGSFARLGQIYHNLPAQIYRPFVERLMTTARKEIGRCLAACFRSLPLRDAASFLLVERADLGANLPAGWALAGDTLHLPRGAATHKEENVVARALHYAYEIDKIV